MDLNLTGEVSFEAAGSESSLYKYLEYELCEVAQWCQCKIRRERAKKTKLVWRNTTISHIKLEENKSETLGRSGPKYKGKSRKCAPF